MVGIGAVKQTGRHRLARPPTLGLQTVSGRVPMREISCAVLCWTWTSVCCCCHRCRQTGWRDRGLFHAALYGGAGAGLILLSVNTLDCMESALPDRSRSPVLAAGSAKPASSFPSSLPSKRSWMGLFIGGKRRTLTRFIIIGDVVPVFPF